MNKREKAVANTLILILPFLWSFLTQSDLNSRLKLNIVCPLILFILLLFTLSEKLIRQDKDMYGAMVAFILFAAYAVINSGINLAPLGVIPVLLTMSTMLSYIYLGQNIKTFGFISYGYAAISIVILVDFVTGGLTAGWNTNSIGMVTINGVYFMLLSIAIDDGRFWIFKISIAAIIVLLITVTDCRSALFGTFMYFIIRAFLIKRHISKGYFRTLIIILTAAPYLIMRLYLSLYNSSYKDKLDQLAFKYTGKVLFTERELVWKYVFKGLTGTRYWFGTGRLIDGNAHNIYVDIWYTLGLVGVIAFGVLIVYFMLKVYDHINDRIIKATICCFYGMFLSQTFETSFFRATSITFNAGLYMFVAIILGRYITLKNEEKKAKEERGSLPL